jgi:YVTN family beta-propeller protein
VALDRKRALAVAACFDANQAAVIDTNNYTVLKKIPVGTQPQFVTFSADGRLAYIANDGSDTVTTIDLSDYTTHTVSTGHFPTSMAISPDGSKGYVSNFGDGTLTVLNLG